MENKTTIIIDSIPHCPSGKRICQNIAKPRNVATLLNRTKLEYLSSIVFHTVLVAREYVKTSKTKKCRTLLIWRTKLEYLSSIVFHTVLVAREYVKTSKTKKCGYIA